MLLLLEKNFYIFYTFIISQLSKKMGDISLEEARKAMIAKRFGGNAKGASTGGTGSARRKVKGAHKAGGGKILSYF